METKYVMQSHTSKDYRIKSILICAILMVFSLTAFGLMIYNIAKLKFGFAIGYIIGIIFAILFIFIRMNIAFSTGISVDRKYVMLTSWENRLLPFNTKCTIPFIREFIPARNIKERININDIDYIYIGTRSFILRNMQNENFDDIFNKYVSESDFKKVNKSDIFCILANDEIYFMSIENFDSKSICKVVQNILRVNNKVDFYTGSKKYKVNNKFFRI